MIIDGHAHMGASWLGMQSNEITIEKLIKIYDYLKVDLAVLSSLQLSYDIEAGNKETYSYTKKYPKRIIGFGSICPRDRKKALDEIKRCINDYGFKGLKLHPSVNEYMIDSTIVDPVIELASSYSLPVLIHSSPDGFGHPRMIGALAQRHPEVKMIMGHMGGSAWLESIEIAKKNKNVILDTTNISNEWYIIPTVIEEVGVDRIIWGSDAPVLNIAVELSRVKSIDLYGEVTQNDKNLILGKNMAKILKL